MKRSLAYLFIIFPILLILSYPASDRAEEASVLYVDNAWDFSDGYARVEVAKRFGFVNTSGKFAIAPTFERESIFTPPVWDFSEGLAQIKIGERYGYLDKSGKLVIDPKFDNSWKFSSSASPRSRSGGKWDLLIKPERSSSPPRLMTRISSRRGWRLLK